MPAGLWVVLCACQAAPEGGAWVQGRHFTAFGGRGGVLRVDVKKPRRWRSARPGNFSLLDWKQIDRKDYISTLPPIDASGSKPPDTSSISLMFNSCIAVTSQLRLVKLQT